MHPGKGWGRDKMNITILGGGGFLGRKIADHLAATGKLGPHDVTSLTLFDLHPPPPLAAPFPVHCRGGDVALLAHDVIGDAPTSSFISRRW